MTPRFIFVAPIAVLVMSLSGCDRPGPLSSAVRGNHALPPIQPGWGAPLHDRALKQVFPAATTCMGFVDRYQDRYVGARRVVGWSWNLTLKQPMLRLAVVDSSGRMVAFGEGGSARPDVAVVHPDFDAREVGWDVIAPTRERQYGLFGIDEASHSSCYIAALKP